MTFCKSLPEISKRSIFKNIDLFLYKKKKKKKKKKTIKKKKKKKKKQ